MKYDFEPTTENLINNSNKNKLINRIHLTELVYQSAISVKEYLLQNIENIVFLVIEKQKYIYYPTTKTKINNSLILYSDKPNIQLEKIGIPIKNAYVNKEKIEYFIQPYGSQYGVIEKPQQGIINMFGI